MVQTDSEYITVTIPIYSKTDKTYAAKKMICRVISERHPNVNIYYINEEELLGCDYRIFYRMRA